MKVPCISRIVRSADIGLGEPTRASIHLDHDANESRKLGT